MTCTLAEYEAIRSAYVLGVNTVTHDGKTVVYRSRAEMAAVMREMERYLYGRRPNVGYAVFSRGE